MEKFRGKYRIESNRCKYWDYSSPGFYFVTVCIINRECILGNIHQDKMQLSEYGEIVENEILKMPEYNNRTRLDEWTIMPNHIHLLIELTNEKTDNTVDVDWNGNVVDGDGNGNDNADGNDDGDDNGNGNGNDGGNGNGNVGGNVEKIHEFSLPTPQPTSQPTPQPTPQQPWWHNRDYKPTIDEIKQYRKQRRKMIIPKIIGKLQMQTSKQINILRNTPGNKNWQPNYHDHIVRDDASYQRIKNYIINNPRNWNDDTFNAENNGGAA